MKTLAAILLGFTTLLAISVFALETGTRDVVEKRYATLQDARNSGFPARVWLPEIIPESTVNIRTAQNVDLNTAEGEFSVAVEDYAAFAARLTPYTPAYSPFENFRDKVTKLQRQGRFAGVFREGRTVWVFICIERTGECEFTMWLERG